MRILKSVTVLFLLILTGCSSDSSNDVEERFPFIANIEYRVSSNTGASTAQLRFKNETKEEERVSRESLPFVYGFDVSVEFGDQFYISALTSANNLKVSLYIDGALIKEAEGNETGSNIEVIVHQFGIVDVTAMER